jgi:hypothetical protein
MVADLARRHWLGDLAKLSATRVMMPIALDATAYNMPPELRELNYLRPTGLPLKASRYRQPCHLPAQRWWPRTFARGAWQASECRHLGGLPMGTALIQLETDHDRECRCWATLSGPNVIQLVVTASRGSSTSSQDARTLYDLLLIEARRAGARAPHRRDAAALAPAQCRHDDARGSEVSPSSLL